MFRFINASDSLVQVPACQIERDDQGPISSPFLKHSEPDASGKPSVYGTARAKNRQYSKHYFVKKEDDSDAKANPGGNPVAHTVQDLKEASPYGIRAIFGVVMERTCRELRALSCLAL
jgi:hypothetical protein